MNYLTFRKTNYTMKGFLPLAAAALLLLNCSGPSAQNTNLSPDRFKAVFTEAPVHVPSSKTPDGPLAGNGDIGIVLGGNPDSLTVYIAKNDFWRAYPVYPGGGIAAPGGLDLHIPELAGASYYAEQLPGSARIHGKFVKDDLEVELSLWVTATRNRIIAEFKTNRAVDIHPRIWVRSGNTSRTEKGYQDGIAWASRSFEGTNLLEWPVHVALAMEVPQAGSMLLEPESTTAFSVSAYTNHDASDWKGQALADAAIAGTNLESARKEHREWWDDFWARSNISIGDDFFEDYYHHSLYLMACSSREGKFAPGIWGAFVSQDSSAWGGDYHLNYNYQAPYWALYASNHIAETDNFDQPLLDYMDAGRIHARRLLDCNGIYYPVGIGPLGLCTTRWPLTPQEMLQRYGTLENTIDDGYKFLGQKINAVFSVGNMLMRFYSTYDEAYARRVYPYIEACADFWEDYLIWEDGRYVIYQDHVHEIYPNLRNKGIWRNRLGDVNSTLSLGLVKMLFSGILDVSEYLGTDLDRREKWTHIVEHLSDYPTGITPDGRISLKSMERGPGDNEVRAGGLNRVSIHGLVLPGGVCGPITDSAFNAMLLEDVAHWKDVQSEKGGWSNTFGNGIETCFPAAVRVGYDPDIILSELRDRIEAAVYPNRYIIQNGGGIEVFTAVPMTINEMLMQSYEHVVRVFPVWNRTKDASFENLRAYGAFLVSSSLKRGDVEQVRLYSEKGRPCRMENPWPGAKVRIYRNGKKAETLSGPIIEFPTNAGESIEVKPVR